MERKLFKILRLCLDLKAQGHDAFFDYSPHVQCVYVSYCDHWTADKAFDCRHTVYLDKPYAMQHLDEIIDFLTGKLEGGESDGSDND